MKNLKFCLFVLIILASAWGGAATTDLRYTFGGSSIGREAAVSEDQGFHGPHSVKLAVISDDNPIVKKRKERYAAVSATPRDPLRLADLDQMMMQILPVKGDSRVQLEIQLDGDGNGKYSASSFDDVLLSTSKEPLQNTGVLRDKWNELNAFDFSYDSSSKDKAKKFKRLDLDEFQRHFGSLRVVKLWIRLYDAPGDFIAYLDYIRIGSHMLSFEPLEKEVIKKAPKSVSPGSKITYTITYGNDQNESVDLKVIEQYDPRTAFIEATPEPDPGTNNIWTIKGLSPGRYGQIKISMRTVKPRVEADMDGSVSGSGHASVRKRLSTEQSGYLVTNRVILSSARFNLIAATTTGVRTVEGSVLTYAEHGSGSYGASEKLSFIPSKISLQHDTTALQRPASIDIRGRSLTYNSSWCSRSSAENRISEKLLAENHLYADRLNTSSNSGIRSTSRNNVEAWIESESNFSGLANYQARWQDVIALQSFFGAFHVSSRERGLHHKGRQSSTAEWLECCPDPAEYYEEDEENDTEENETEDDNSTVYETKTG